MQSVAPYDLVSVGDELEDIVRDMGPPSSALGSRADEGTRREASIHARDAIVAASEKSLPGLQSDEREHPVLGSGSNEARRLEVVVLRGHQHVESVGCELDFLQASQDASGTGGCKKAGLVRSSTTSVQASSPQ